MTPYLQILRPQQWVKNAFVFLPIFFGGSADNLNSVASAGVAFVVFTLVASGVYCMNDLHDCEADRRHPANCNRPLPSGRISPAAVLVMMVVLMALALAVSAVFGGPNRWIMVGVVAIYIAINVAYTFALKRHLFVGVAIVALCYVLRVILGGVAAEIYLSPWIILMTFTLATFLCLGKRYDEEMTMKIGTDDTRGGLLILVKIVAILCLAFYFSYTVTPEVMDRFHSRYVCLTTLFVIAGIGRYLSIINKGGKAWAPAKVLLTDPYIIASVVGWLATFVIIIYL